LQVKRLEARGWQTICPVNRSRVAHTSEGQEVDLTIEENAMKRLQLILMGLAVTGLVLAVSSPGALARTECNAPFPLAGTTVDGGLDVGPGDTCLLEMNVVNGGVRMTGGSLQVCGSTINGGVRVAGGDCVVLGASVDDLNACLGNSISGGVGVSLVMGTGLFCTNAFANVELEGNNINGAVKLDNNGTVQVEANTINGSLECSGNTSVSNDGFKNTVTGKESGQCTGL
jgi:hypothetical protein